MDTETSRPVAGQSHHRALEPRRHFGQSRTQELEVHRAKVHRKTTPLQKQEIRHQNLDVTNLISSGHKLGLSKILN